MLLPLLLLLLLLPLRLASELPPLLFAQSSVFQFTVGTSMPIASGKKGGLAATLAYQFNYALPWNASQLQASQFVHARASRQAEGPPLRLSAVYLSFEELLQRYGWGDARQCMLRTICELAELPLHGRPGSVIERIIHLLLTPSEDGDGDEDPRETGPYDEAELLGKSSRGQCALAYGGCLGSPLDSFTELLV